MSFSVIIPARYASTRLPGKPLLAIGGEPMLQHVHRQASRSEADQVIIATDDERIEQAAYSFGAKVCMTNPQHPSGTDRLQEVVSSLGLHQDSLVVNVQGDEPLIPPAIINQVARLLAQSPDAGMATLSEPIDSVEDLFNPNVVKVVQDKQGNALYFSRAPIPWSRQRFNATGTEQSPESLKAFGFQRHIGIYAYRVGFLNDFVTWPPALLEQTEALEQLRALYQGVRIKVAQAHESPPAGVDTEADLRRVRRLIEAGRSHG